MCLAIPARLVEKRDHDQAVVDLGGIRKPISIALVPEAEWTVRTPIELDVSPYQVGTGRELFAGLRQRVSGAEQGAMTFGWTEQGET